MVERNNREGKFSGGWEKGLYDEIMLESCVGGDFWNWIKKIWIFGRFYVNFLY